MTLVNVDGTRVRIRKDFEDSEMPAVQHIVQPTELGDTLKQLNDDSIEANTKMSGIDMRARLHYIEVASVLAVDSLVALRVLPVRCLALSRQKKRLSVSLNGMGRREIVDISVGKMERDKDMPMGFKDKFKQFFSSQK